MLQQSELTPIAIVSIDLSGYCRLMELDESATHQAMMTCHREILQPTIDRHCGKIVKSTGDGALLAFSDAPGAVRGMIEFQQHMATWSKSQATDRRLEYRVGIHEATAIVEDGDIYGNGVNLAVRLQELASPGSVLVSQTVVDRLGEEASLIFKYSGRDRLKNIKEPVHTYHWKNGRLKASRQRPLQQLAAVTIGLAVISYPLGSPNIDEGFGNSPWIQTWAASEHEAQIAIFPFAYQSSTSGFEDLTEKLPNAIAANLAKNSNLFVHNQSQGIWPGQRAGYQLEGVIEENSDEIRVSVQLMDNQAGRYVWGEDFDSKSNDLATLEHRVARRVASSIAMTVHSSERIVQSRSENAYRAYLRAIAHYDRNTPSDLSQVVTDLKEALIWDTEYSRAHALLAAAYWTSWQNRWQIDSGMTAEKTLASAKIHLKKANEPSAITHSLTSEMLMQGGNHAEAIAEAEKAIVLEPDASFGYYSKGLALAFGGRPDEAELFIRKAIQLNPHGQRYLFGLALTKHNMGRFYNAARTLKRAITQNREDDWSFLLLAAAYGQLRWADHASAALASFDDLSKQRRGWTSRNLPYVLSWPFRYDVDRQRLHQGMYLAGVNRQIHVAIRQ